MDRVKNTIKCERTLELISKSLRAGYIDPETKKLHQEDIGTPQGSVLSPILSNIVLHELDKFMEELKTKFHKGTQRRRNPAYVKIISKKRSVKDVKIKKQMLRTARRLHSKDQMDENFRRLRYVRYADDFVVLIIGTHEEAEGIKIKIKNFLEAKCGLTLSMDKTVISHLKKQSFKFLGANCVKADRTKSPVVKHLANKSSRANERLRMNVDLDKVNKKLVTTGFAKYKSGTTTPVGTAYNPMLLLSHYEIVSFFNSKFRGIYNFYSFAGDRRKL